VSHCPTSQKYIYSPFCVSLSHQQKIHPPSLLCLTVPPDKITFTLLFVSHCPTSKKYSHPPFCASLSHQPKIHPLSLLSLTVPPVEKSRCIFG
jgi:hypothetical protein